MFCFVWSGAPLWRLRWMRQAACQSWWATSESQIIGQFACNKNGQAKQMRQHGLTWGGCYFCMKGCLLILFLKTDQQIPSIHWKYAFSILAGAEGGEAVPWRKVGSTHVKTQQLLCYPSPCIKKKLNVLLKALLQQRIQLKSICVYLVDMDSMWIKNLTNNMLGAEPCTWN